MVRVNMAGVNLLPRRKRVNAPFAVAGKAALLLGQTLLPCLRISGSRQSNPPPQLTTDCVALLSLFSLAKTALCSVACDIRDSRSVSPTLKTLSKRKPALSSAWCALFARHGKEPMT